MKNHNHTVNFVNTEIFNFIPRCVFTERSTFFAIISISSKHTYNLLPIHEWICHRYEEVGRTIGPSISTHQLDM